MLDSGLGGLTVLSALRAFLGGLDVVYFADTAHVPYGDRPLEEVASLGRRIVERLLEYDPAIIIVASGTTCAAFDAAGKPDDAGVPLLGVVGPGARAACAATRNGRIGVVATNATVKSGIFDKKILDIRPDAFVQGVGAPALVPIVETGGWASAHARNAVATYCGAISAAGCDTVVLGCTHFPHLQTSFSASLGPDVQIVDPGAACAQGAVRYLAPLKPAAGRLTFEVSGDVKDFAAKVSLLSGMKIDDIKHVPLEIHT